MKVVLINVDMNPNHFFALITQIGVFSQIDQVFSDIFQMDLKAHKAEFEKNEARNEARKTDIHNKMMASNDPKVIEQMMTQYSKVILFISFLFI